MNEYMNERMNELIHGCINSMYFKDSMHLL